MKNVKKKFWALLILIILLTSNILPTVYATYEETVINNEQNDVEDLNKIIVTENKDNNFNEEDVVNKEKKDTNKTVSNLDVLLAGILKQEKSDINYSDVDNIISSINLSNAKGIWIPEDDRTYIINFVNTISNSIYNCNENGFLIKEGEKTGNKIRGVYSYYTKKIDELVDSNNLIVLCIDDSFKSLNEFNNEILDMFMEDDEFAMLFKAENDELLQVAILNSSKYNCNNEFDSLATLMNHFLELFYNDDQEFVEYIQDKINSVETFSSNSLKMKNSNNTEEQYQVVMAGLLDENLNDISQVDNILTTKPTGNGVWITERAREFVLNLINSNTQMTYGVDNEGYLTITNKNEIQEKDFNNVEKSLNEIIAGDKFVVIDLSDYYMEKLDDSNAIESFVIEKKEYKKVFTTSESKIIILNSNVFNTSNVEDENDILMSYVLEEFIYTHEEQYETTNSGIDLLYSMDIEATMGSAQNVYAGPSGENYARVGSVSAGEWIIVLEAEFGWYQIEYETSSGNKVGFVPKSSVPSVDVSDTSVPYSEGGLAIAHSGNIDVYYGNSTTAYAKVGTIYQGEGVTLLQKIDEIAYIEYATSSGTKRGIVNYDDLYVVEKSSVARVTNTSSAYSGPDSDFVKLGGAYYNEYVVVLEKMEDWVFVEYNTTSGRKCGFMSANKLNIFKSIVFYDFSEYNGLKKATEQLTVYGGPNSNYARLGTVYNQEVVSYLRNIERIGQEWAYIEYNTSNGAKRGYVEADKLEVAKAPSIPVIPSYPNFTKGSYSPNKTYKGNNLDYYSIGNGNNSVFLVFEQHGWEDAWAYDGIELVNIASNVMNDLSNFYNENQNVFDYWKIYVIPYANPDGITDGFSNNGPGRTTFEPGRRIDMNRSWPANFSPYYTSRNYTGPLPLGKHEEDDYGAGEIRGLKDFIDSNLGTNNIIIDTHGWLNLTYGDLSLGRYFSEYFGFGNNGSYGTGYLIRYGQSIGAKSCLVELPKPTDSTSIVTNNYSGKFASSVRDMLLGEMEQVLGGEDVDEICKIYSTGSVNVRELPNTSATIVTSLSNGTLVTRIKKNVTTSNGYTWDKIRLSDGREGYIATNFLEVMPSNDIIFEINDSDTAIQALKAYLRYHNINNYDDTPTAILDEDTAETIKVYQTSNGLSETGNFDRYTIEKMGFSLDSTNKIIENDYYNTYLQYALNYINYGNPTQVTYVEIPVYLTELERYNRFVYGKTYTSLSPNTQESITSMEAKFNQMPDDERDQRSSEIAKAKSKFQSLADSFMGNLFYPNASDSLNRFMDKSGSKLIHTNIPDEVEDNTGHYNVYKDYVRRAANAAEQFAPEDGDKTYTFALEYEASAQFGESNKNLWASIGKYRIEMVCDVVKTGDTYNMSVNYTIKDYYDWIEGSDEEFNFGVTTVVEDQGFILHYSGNARCFHQEGSPLQGTYTWEKGNSQTVV